MADLFRHRVAWTGFTGAPGVSTFYSLTSGTLEAQLHTFFAALVTLFPPVVHIQVEEAGDIIDESNGALVGSWTGTVTTPIVGTGAALYSAPVGACVTWGTDTVLDSHRVKGRTFLVPLSAENGAGDGTLDEPRRAAVIAAAHALQLAAAGDLVIWHRPRAARAADGSRPEVTARAGGHGVVTTSSVRDVAAVLRSRRD